MQMHFEDSVYGKPAWGLQLEKGIRSVIEDLCYGEKYNEKKGDIEPIFQKSGPDLNQTEIKVKKELNAYFKHLKIKYKNNPERAKAQLYFDLIVNIFDDKMGTDKRKEFKKRLTRLAKVQKNDQNYQLLLKQGTGIIDAYDNMQYGLIRRMAFCCEQVRITEHFISLFAKKDDFKKLVADLKKALADQYQARDEIFKKIKDNNFTLDVDFDDWDKFLIPAEGLMLKDKNFDKYNEIARALNELFMEYKKSSDKPTTFNKNALKIVKNLHKNDNEKIDALIKLQKDIFTSQDSVNEQAFIKLANDFPNKSNYDFLKAVRSWSKKAPAVKSESSMRYARNLVRAFNNIQVQLIGLQTTESLEKLKDNISYMIYPGNLTADLSTMQKTLSKILDDSKNDLKELKNQLPDKSIETHLELLEPCNIVHRQIEGLIEICEKAKKTKTPAEFDVILLEAKNSITEILAIQKILNISVSEESAEKYANLLILKGDITDQYDVQALPKTSKEKLEITAQINIQLMDLLITDNVRSACHKYIVGHEQMKKKEIEGETTKTKPKFELEFADVRLNKLIDEIDKEQRNLRTQTLTKKQIKSYGNNYQSIARSFEMVMGKAKEIKDIISKMKTRGVDQYKLVYQLKEKTKEYQLIREYYQIKTSTLVGDETREAAFNSLKTDKYYWTIKLNDYKADRQFEKDLQEEKRPWVSAAANMAIGLFKGKKSTANVKIEAAENMLKLLSGKKVEFTHARLDAFYDKGSRLEAIRKDMEEHDALPKAFKKQYTIMQNERKERAEFRTESHYRAMK